MILFRIGLAVPEKRGLTEMVEELVAPLANLLAVHLFRVGDETAHVCFCLHRTSATKRIRLVTNAAPIDCLTHVAVTLGVVNSGYRTIDRNLVRVRSAQTYQLRIGVREQTTLEERIIGDIDAGHDVAGVKRDLLRFGEKVVGIAIKGQFSYTLDRNQFLRDDFRRIKKIKVELMLVFFFDALHAELPFRIVAVLDGFP